MAKEKDDKNSSAEVVARKQVLAICAESPIPLSALSTSPLAEKLSFQIPASSFASLGSPVTSASLLMLPARTLRGSFCWVTCPSLLRRFASEASEFGYASYMFGKELGGDIEVPPAFTAYIAGGNRCTRKKKISLEQFSLSAVRKTQISYLASWLSINAFPRQKEFGWWINKMRDDVVLVNDEDFGEMFDALLNIRFNEISGEKSAYLPVDSIFFAILGKESWERRDLPKHVIVADSDGGSLRSPVAPYVLRTAALRSSRTPKEVVVKPKVSAEPKPAGADIAPVVGGESSQEEVAADAVVGA